MKNSLLILLALILFSCNNIDHYTIKGYVQDRDTGVVRLSQYNESWMDSKECELVDGKFIFQGSIKSPEQFILIYEESGPQSTFESFSTFIEPSAEVNVVLFPDSISKSHITGSKLAKEFSEAKQIIESNYEVILDELINKYNTAIMNNDSVSQTIIMRKGDSVNNEIKKWKLGYIEDNPKSYISAYFLFSFHHFIDIDTVKKYYKILDNSLSESKYSSRIESFLSVLPGNQLRDFELYDANNKLHKLSIISKDKVVLIDFWASWCGPCREQNEKLASLYEIFKSRGFEIVGVSIDRDTAAFINTIKEDNMTWINLIDRTDQTAVSKIYRSSTIPSNVLIDRNGTITHKDIKLENLETAIESLLKK